MLNVPEGGYGLGATGVALSVRTERIVLGIVLRLAAMALFSVMGAGVKWAADRGVPLMEILLFRNAFAFLPLAIYIQRTTGFSVLRTSRPLSHFARGCIGLVAMSCNFLAIAYLPLVEATALSFTAPLFLTALSKPLLRERVGVHRWMAVILGFVGVLIMIRPEPGHLAGLGMILGLLGALASAGAMATIRQISRTEPAVTIVFYFSLAGTLFGLIGTALHPVALSPDLVAILIGVGILGGLGQMAQTQALAHAPVAAIAPFDYSQLLWASALGYVFWDELPTAWTIAGACVVAASGLYIVYREVRRARGR